MPQALKILCAYDADGSSMNKMCEPPGNSPQCMPGCPLGHADASWCRTSRDTQCAWRSDQLQQMLSQQQQREQSRGSYNEVVLDPSAWVANLPHTIVAGFYPSYASQEHQAYARAVHRKFLRAYALTSEDVPMVEYNPRRGRQPFSLLRET